MLTDYSPNLGLSCSSLGELTFRGDWLDCCQRETCQSSQPCTMSEISVFEQANLGIAPVYITRVRSCRAAVWLLPIK